MSVVVSGLLSRAKAFWPMLAGIICARTALIVACYGSYASTDDGIFTDGSMFVTCALFIVALLIFSRSRRELGATAVQWIMVGSIIVAAGASMALSLLDSADQALVATAFALSIASTLALSLCMFYWLRCLRGTDEVTAALFVFSAFFISVGIVYLLSFLPTRAQNIIGMALIVAQFAFLGPAGLRAEHPTERPHRRARTFFTFARSNIQDSRFLAACAVGMALLGFVDGFLRGYPDGLPIPFTWSSRLAYALCSMLICALLMLLVVRRRERVMTVDAFITMALLASLSLVLFGAFPYHWEIGAVAVNTLNIVICAYCWYVIIAFTSFGTRDPYVYAMGGWVICFGSRSLARMLLYFTYPLAGNDLLINSLLEALVLISTQVVLVQFMHAERGESSAEADRLEAENERVMRQAEADAAESAAALAEAEQTLQSVVFNAARREATAQQTASEALKAAEARQCIRCNEECAAIREQLFQIDPASASPGSTPSPSPLGDNAVASRLFTLLCPGVFPCPFPVHHGRAVRFHASQRGAHGRAFPAHQPRDGRAHPLRAGSHTEESGRRAVHHPRHRAQPHQAHLQQVRHALAPGNPRVPQFLRKLGRPHGREATLPALARHSLRHHGRLLPRCLRHRLQRPQRRPRGDPRRSHRRQRRLLLARSPQA